MKNKYLIVFECSENIIIEIEKKDRPNNVTDDELIIEYLEREYGNGDCEIIELDTVEVVKI